MAASEADMLELAKAFQATPPDELPRTPNDLQTFVDKHMGIVSHVIAAALDHDKLLTPSILESAGVKLHPKPQDLDPEHINLQRNGLWSRSLDVQQYEDNPNSYIGSTFIRWMVKEKRRLDENSTGTSRDSQKLEVADFVPPVDATLKIYHIDSINMKDDTFGATFAVLLDWEDPSIAFSMSDEFNFAEHFCPKYTIDNGIPTTLVELSHNSRPRRDKTTWHVKWTSKYQATLKASLDGDSYPFDFQELRITLKPHTFNIKPLSFLGKAPYDLYVPPRMHVGFQHPVRWRRALGHCLAKNADGLPDFDLVGIHARRDHESYSVVVGIKRNSSEVVMKVFRAMTIISIMSSFSFFIPDFADALAVVVTALLTAVTFQTSMGDQLPASSKPLSIDQYLTFCNFQFFYQACCNCIIHLSKANLAEGIFAEEGLTCMPEVEFFRVSQQWFRDDINATTPVIEGDGIFWCNFLTVINVAMFSINLILVIFPAIFFLQKSR